jgi:mannose-6-phosphate isomerase-like protein (cupin superfamily)
MKKPSLRDLSGRADGPILSDAVPGFTIERGGVSRYPAGERTHPEGHHVHTVPELFLILQGSGVIEIDGAATPYEAGDVFVVDPGEDHHLVSRGELPLVSMWIHLQPAS